MVRKPDEEIHLATTMKTSITTTFAIAISALAPPADLPIANSPFRPDMKSLKHYECPDWFRDAKFGILSHWGPQAVPERGDWYARNMYVPRGPRGNCEHHVETYGHPSEFGYKDIIPL